ncbi:MAG TPA: hypothetical protein VLU41_11145 [Ideonella sp.]|nr:hypothetical protein [Ideonella sp.]
MRRPRKHSDEGARLDGRARRAEDRVPTYQELLDEAIAETFPASDPISPSAAMHTGRRISTPRDGVDWTLVPGAAAPPR